MIEVRDLAKRYRSGRGKEVKTVAALQGVSFVAPDGSLTALLGPNGAGKTTTIRILATLVAPDSGHARVDAFDTVTEARSARAVLGVLSDGRGLYTRLTARENIRYYGRLRGMTDDAIDAATNRLAELVDMRALLDRRTEGFSQGERMKVALARALVHDPQNLVLDEPTNGLDIMTTRAVRELLRHLRDGGKCILMSSHIMQEIEALADDVALIAQGRVVASGSVAELLEKSGTGDLEDAFVELTREGR